MHLVLSQWQESNTVIIIQFLIKLPVLLTNNNNNNNPLSLSTDPPYRYYIGEFRRASKSLPHLEKPNIRDNNLLFLSGLGQ